MLCSCALARNVGALGILSTFRARVRVGVNCATITSWLVFLLPRIFHPAFLTTALSKSCKVARSGARPHERAHAHARERHANGRTCAFARTCTWTTQRDCLHVHAVYMYVRHRTLYTLTGDTARSCELYRTAGEHYAPGGCPNSLTGLDLRPEMVYFLVRGHRYVCPLLNRRKYLIPLALGQSIVWILRGICALPVPHKSGTNKDLGTKAQKHRNIRHYGKMYIYYTVELIMN